jgi:serine/threonine protein phosphatase PrpC
VLLAGVMDGHGGTAASSMVSSEFPNLLSTELLVNRIEVPKALENAWETVCLAYRQRCNNEETCIADYDPAQGVLMANTGSEDLIAGTTASIMALDKMTAKLSILNCGDSRSMVATEDGLVKFDTKDHKPQAEEDRILEGIMNGLDYSRPQCSWSRWWIKVGDYEYSVARSLEGPFATSKGIVSDPDLTILSVIPGDMLISATDGLWDVMDSREVAIYLSKLRKEGMSASDSAKALCATALRKGTSDNVSSVVVFL